MATGGNQGCCDDNTKALILKHIAWRLLEEGQKLRDVIYGQTLSYKKIFDSCITKNLLCAR